MEGLETRNLLAQVYINSTADWDKHLKDGAYQVGGDHDEVTIQANVIFNTDKDITLHGKSITIHDGVQIVSDGKITIEAENKLTTLGINAINQIEDLFASNLNASITIGDSVLIQGDTVDISADSGNPRVLEDKEWANFVNSALHKVSAILQEKYEVPDLLSLPLTFQMWKPESTIVIGTEGTLADKATKIIGTDEITITSDAKANAIGKAIANGSFRTRDKLDLGLGAQGAPLDLSSRLAIAAGLFITHPTASIRLQNSIVSSAGDIEISTDVENVIELEAKALKNTGLSKTHPNGISVSLAWSEQKTTSTILVDKDSLISSVGGNIAIEAKAANDNSTSSAAAVYRDGVAGIAPAILDGCGIFHTDNGCNPETSPATEVWVHVDGQVTSLTTSAPESTPPANLSFNPSFVADIGNSKVTLSGLAELKTGDPVQITSDQFGTIPGLVRGVTYYVIVAQNSGSNPTYNLRFAATANDAYQNNYLSFGKSYPTLSNTRTGQKVPVTQTAADKDQRSLIMFTFDKGTDGVTPLFQDGDEVTFVASNGRFLGFTDASGELKSLTDGATYGIKIIESKSKAYPLTIQLLDQSNTPLAIYGGSYLESESGVRYPISDINNQNGQVDLRREQLSSSDDTVSSIPPAIPVVQGQKLFFHDGLQEASASLQDGTAYWAIVDPSNVGVIQLAISPAQAEAADPSVQEALAHLTATFQGLQIPLTTDGKPNGLVENQTFSVTLGSTTKTFVFTSSGYLTGNWPTGTVAVKLVSDSAESQATEIINAILRADMGLQPSYEGNGRIAIGTQTNLAIQSSSALQVASVSVDIPIGNFESGVGLVFGADPRLVDNLRVIYHAVPGKPLDGLIDGGAYYVYKVNNSNYNPAVPQYILSLMNAAEISSSANSGSFALKITAPNGSQKTTSSIAWNASASEIESAINALALTGVSVQVTGSGQDSTSWVIVGLNADAVTTAVSSLTHAGAPVGLHIAEAAPNIVMGSSADAGTFTLRVTNASGSEGLTGNLAWNSTAAQLQAAIAGLNLSGLSVTVGGSGSLQDPWNINGLNPSQVVIDSTKLLDGEKQTNMQMTSALQVQFGYGQYLEDASGYRYLVTGANLDNGSITIRLPDVAPVVASDSSQLTSDGSGVPKVQFEAVPADAFEMFSFAVSGTFTITVQRQDGTSSTTSALAYNASPTAIAAALNALPGINVSVSGLGTLSSPWLVSGVTLDAVTVNSSLLRESGRNANMLSSEKMTTVYRVWTEHASGGQFTLTLHAAGQDTTTGALSYDVSADDLNTALRNLSGMTSQVSGSGTQADPWVLVTGSQPIKTGDALVFHDSWSMSVLGMIDGRTYYAVVGQQGIDPEEISLQLAATDADSTAASPVLMEMRPYLPLEPASSASFSGSPVMLKSQTDSEESDDGITIKAELESSTSVGSYANLGGFPLFAYFVHGGWNSAKNKGNNVLSEIEYEIKKKLGGDNEDLANKGEGVGAVAAQWVSNNVQVDIGPTAKLGALGVVTIGSEINQTVGTLSNAGLLKTNTNTEKGSFGVAVAFAYSNIWNTSKAVVSSDAIVTGANGVDVQSHINYAPPSRFGLNDGISKGWGGVLEVAEDLENAFDLFIFGNLPFVPAFFNSAANVGVVGSTKKSEYLWTASFSYEIIHNNNLAQIADGAQINDASNTFDVFDPDATPRSPHSITPSPEENFVNIIAKTDVRQWGLAGQLYFSLPYLIHSKAQLGQKKDSKWTDSERLDDWLGFRSSTKNVFGGSVSLITMDGLTQALLGGADPDGHTPSNANTTVYYGAGGLNLWADTRNGIVNVAQASANSSGWGIEGSVAYVAMGEPHATVKPDDRRQKTYAKMISRNRPLNVLPIEDSEGDVDVKATDLSFGWAITGSIMIGQSKGIGLSGSIVELTRDVQASIGSQYNHQQDDSKKYYMDPYRTSAESGQSSGSSLQTNGFITVESHASGTIVPLSLVGAGAVRSKGYLDNSNEVEIDNSGVESLEKNIAGFNEYSFLFGESPSISSLEENLKERKEYDSIAAPAEGAANGQSDTKGKWGFFISGDFAAAFVSDQVYGYVNLEGNIESQHAGEATEVKTLSVNSGNSTTVNPGAGSFALQWSRDFAEKKQNSVGFAGSVALAVVESDVQSVIDGPTIKNMALTLVAENKKKIGSGAAGFQLDSPAGFDLQVAGSVVINSISNTTVASLRNSTLTDIFDLEIKAYANDRIYGLAGTAQVSLAPFEGGTVVGVGMSAVWNDTNNTTTAEIVDCPSITQILGDTQVIAEDFTTSTANSFGTQITVTSGSVVDIGGMWTTNLLFPNTTAQITGSNLTNTNPNSDATILVSAALAPMLESFAGYFAIGVSTSEKAEGQLGVGAAVIVTRLGNKKEELDDPTDNYKTLSQISHSTIEAYDSVDVFALTGNLNDDTRSYVPDQSESELSDSSKDRYNIRSLAIAGGLQAGFAPLSISAQGSFVSTKTRIATIALVTDSANILQASAHASELTVQAINQVTAHTDSGGVSAAITFSGSVGVAFGGAVNQYNSFNRTEALIDGSTVNASNATVSARLAPFVENIAFGVALSGSTGVAVGESGADLHLNQYDTSNAGVSNAVVTTTGDLKIASHDDSFLKTNSGSGTLSIGTGGVGLAFGAVFNIVRVRNDILAWIGTKPSSDRVSRSDDPNETPTASIYNSPAAPDTSVITVGGYLTIEATAGQTVKSTTTAVAVSGSGNFALAGSGADGKVNLANIVRAGINDVASLTVTGAGSSDSKPGVTVRAETLGVNSNDSVRDRRVYATIGDFAGVGASYGASIGLSFGQITNDDFVVAQIENSIVTVGSDTSGSSIDVSASDSRYMETKVWVTSIAIALGGAVAGGHSFIYSQPIVIAEVGHGSQIKPKNDSHRSDLSIIATGQESVHAGIFGGAAGLVALGDFIAEADKHGIVGAVLGTVGTLNVGNLTVQALGNHDLDAHGWSLGGGALAISGDGHRLTYDEQIVAWGGGDIGVTNSTAAIVPPSGTTTVNATGNVSLLATSSTKAYSNAGQKPTDDNHSGNWGGAALGFFHAHATYSPTISTQTINLDLTYGGDLELIAQTDNGSSQSRAVTASGAGFGLDFTKAFNTIEPNATLSINHSTLQAAPNSSGTMSLLATNDMQYDTYAYTFAITTIAGGSGSRVFNSFQPIAIVNYLGTNTLTSAGTVNVVTHNAWKRSPNTNDGKSGLVNGEDIYNSSQGAGGGALAEDASTVGGKTENHGAEIVQYVGFDAGDNGKITGGTFTLTYAGKTTDPLDYNAREEDVQDALESLSWPQGGEYLNEKIKVNRSLNKDNKMQWDITFLEGLGTQQVMIDTSKLTFTGNLSPTQSTDTDTLPWSYDGESTIDFGTSTTEIKALDVTKPIDVKWLATQSVDIKELASQKIFGLIGHGYAKSTVALNLENNIWLDQANVNLISGINQLTVGAAADIDALSQTGVNHPLLGGGDSDAVVVVNSTNTYEDKKYDASNHTGTHVIANKVTYIIGGKASDWSDNVTHPIDNSFSANISAVARAVTTGHDYLSNAVINQFINSEINSTISTSEGVLIHIHTSQDTTNSKGYYSISDQSYKPKQPVIINTVNVYFHGEFENIVSSFNIEVLDSGIQVNGNHFDWNAIDQANPVKYQSVVSSPSDPTGTLFLPFAAGKSQSVEGALGEIMDATSLNNFKQNYTVPQTELAYVLQQIEVPQPNIRIVADQIQGTGTVTARVPKLNLVNKTSGWMILNGIASHTNRNAGKVLLLDSQGNPTTAPGLTIHSDPNPDRKIDVSVSPPSSSSAKPFMIVAGYLNAPSSDVTLTNNYGPIIELAPIRAASVTINVPNSAFVVYTPDAYFGTGGNSMLALENAAYANALDPNSSTNPSANLPFLPGQIKNVSDHTYIDPNYIAPAAADYVNGTHTSRIPLAASGPTHVINPQLGAGITAAQIAIFAKSIDINAPLKVGKTEDFSVTLSSDLGNQFRNHKAAYESGSTSNPLLVVPNVCQDSPDVTATYDARTHQITLSSMTISQSVRVLLDGQIVSTVDGSMVQLLGGAGGITQVSNQTGIPLILNNIDAGAANITGSVEFRDTATQINTRYVYTNASDGISVFTTPRGQSYSATPNQTLNSRTIDYQPQVNTLFVSGQRQDIFEATATGFSTSDAGWSPTSVWNFGDVSKSGFAEFQTVNAASISSDQKQLTLTTNGTGGAANAAWLEQPIDVTRSFMVSFRYEGSGDGDGIAFALQTVGTSAIGESGGGLGYGGVQSGIAGNKAAFLINRYDYKDGPHPGVSFHSAKPTANINFWAPEYASSSPVSLSNPMEVQLYYDASKQKWFAFLSDSDGSVHYVTEKDMNLASLFGSSPVFAGFTGSTGLASSTQNVKNFLLVYEPQTGSPFDSLKSDLVRVVNPQLSGYTGFEPAGSLKAEAISGDTITFANDDGTRNYPRAAWYGEKISTDVDSLSVEFTYQASFQNPKIEGFGDFVPQSTSYASAITPGKITLTNGSQSIARAAWYGGEIGTKDDFEINFKYQTDGKAVQGFSNFAAPTNTANAALISPTQLTLTNGSTSIARAAWNKEQVPINYGFTIDFTYQAGGDRNADGIALVFQTQGTNVVGSTGGGLGYVGIAGNKAAYQINIFGGNNQTKGSNFVTGNTSGSYNKTGGIGGVDFSSGDLVHVRLTYDPISNQVFESLTNLSNNNTYSHTYSNINLASVLGTSRAYIGFTGSSGGQTATQLVKDFSFQSNQADGIALVFQDKGTGAIGNSGGGLGYVGISSAKAAYQINLFADSSHTRGSNFVTTNTSGTYNSTGSVNFASGHLIQVQLSYNSHAHQLTEKLTDLISNTTYTKTYSNINLEGLLGPTTYVGFTGGSGALTAVQSVQDFSMEVFPDDGVALVFQSAGTQVSGNAEDGLGYVGISGPTAAYQINLKSNGLQGSNFVATNTAGTYLSTGAVDFASRHPIRVQLNYDNARRQLTESLTDTVTGGTFSRVYHDIDLASAVGPTMYVGFTAPQGGSQTIQTVKNFSLGGSSSTPMGFKQRFAAQPLSKASDGTTTSYATDFSTWVRADHPIRVDFSGISTSNDLNLVSNASLILNGLIRVVNTASLTATSGSITSTSTGSVTARTVGVSAEGTGGFVGTVDNPLNVSLTKSSTQNGFLTARGVSGVYITSPGDLSIGFVSTVSPTDSHDGPVVINASGDVVPYSNSSLIYAGTLSMTAGGSIGSSAKPLQVQLVQNVVLDGSTVAGLLNAQAAGDISIYHFGDVRIGKVKTPGTVAITTHDGNILDGLTLDALGLNDPTLSPQTRRNIHDFITFPEPDLSEEWIDSLEAGVNANYIQYWQLIPVVNFPVQPPLWNSWDPGDWGDIVTTTDSDGNPQRIYQLTAEGIEAFRPKAALDYQKDNPTDSEVQEYANQLWQSCIETFASTDAFGPDWESLPQFQLYDPAYQFTASEETVANIKASFQESFNLFSYLSSQALGSPAAAAAIAKVSNIQAGNLILNSSGSIGENRAAVDIPLEHFQNNTLTDAERQIVRFASQAGEIQLIGKNASGETIYYDAGSPPDSVILTGVRIKISRPLLVQLADTGSLTATSSSELLVIGTSGDLHVKSANSTSKGFVWLEAAEDLLVADGSTGAAVTGGAMRLGAGQAIGTSARPLVISASDKVDLASLADATVESASALEVGQWNVAGTLSLKVEGTASVTDALASQRHSFAGFNGNGAGWTATTTLGSASVSSTATDDLLNVNLNAGTSNTSAWPSQVVFAKNDSVHLSHQFALGFLYQSGAVGSRVVLNLVNADQQGLALVLNLGGADGTGAWADFVKTSEIATAASGQSLGSVLLNSNHPIQVTITYSLLTQTVVASLIDTITKQAIAIEKTGVNITQRLGSGAARLVWTVLGDGATANTHSIRGFRLIDGPVNLVATTLNVVAGGAFGTIANSSTNQLEQPILVLVDGQTQITAGGSIAVEQVVGDLEVGVISSPTNVDISAPFGSVVQSSGGGAGGEGETTLRGVAGPQVSIDALLGVGTTDAKLIVTTDDLSATTSLNHLDVQHQSHTENGLARISTLIAGGFIRLSTLSDVSVTGRVIGQSAQFHSYFAGKSIRLTLQDLQHILGGSLGIVLGGFDSLHLDDTLASVANEIRVGGGSIESRTARITTGVVRSLAMKLGSADDKITVVDASGLSSLNIDGQGGHDWVSIANAGLAISQVFFAGNIGNDELNVDLRNTGVWVTKGRVDTAYGTIRVQDVAKIVLNRLEEAGHPEEVEKIEHIVEEFPPDRLMVVGTAGMDSLAMNSLSTSILLQANWNAQKSERRTYSKNDIRDVQIYLLGGDDFVSVIGTAPIALDIHGGMGNDWIFVQSLAATITDLHGDNVITTGPGDDVIHTGTGNDQIDAGSGKNQIRDDGGINSFTTGDDDDKIWHSNAADWIVAKEGINDIWLHEVHQGWHNKNNPMDVTRDGWVTALDALVLINKLNRTGSEYLLGSADSVQYLYDVSGDGYISPLDVLRTINWLNGNRGGEGESSAEMDTIEPVYGSSSDRAMFGRTSGVSLPGFAPIPSPSPIAGIHEGGKESVALPFDRRETQLNSTAEHHDAVFSDWNPSEWDDLSPFSRSRRNGKR
jgi:hypothetical protein